MPKKPRLSGIKSYRSYTINEAADLTGVSSRTVRNWGNEGLQLLDCARPVLIRGDDLRKFLANKRADKKVTLDLDEFYCCPCRRARKAASGLADCEVVGTRATLTALCESCETVVSKPVAVSRIPEIEGILDVTIKRRKTAL